MIKKFKCGLCKEKDRVVMNRYNLRKHLRDEHNKKMELTNFENKQGRKVNQPWWIIEEE